MKWTQDMPTEEGVYWYQWPNNWKAGIGAHVCSVTVVRDYDSSLCGIPGYLNETEIPIKGSSWGPGWWYGPLEAPPGPDPQRQAEVSLSDLRPAEGNVGPNRGYLEQPEGSQPYGEELDD